MPHVQAGGWAVAALLFASLPALAHVPDFAGPGDTPASARPIGDPQTSRVFYGVLEAGDVVWYGFEAQAGDPIVVSVEIPASQASVPRAWLVGPGLPTGHRPHGAPPGSGALPLGPATGVGFEPFSAQALRNVGHLRLEAPAQASYHVAVQADEGASYALAVGAGEAFTPGEWAWVPAQRVAIQQWGGLSAALAVAGEVVAVGMAMLAIVRRLQAPARARALHHGHLRMALGAVGAAAVAGTAASLAIMSAAALAWTGWTWAVLVPAAFAGAALGLGWLGWRAAWSNGSRWRGVAAAIGAGLAWAGLLLGPLLILAWAVWPRQAAAQGDSAARRGLR